MARAIRLAVEVLLVAAVLAGSLVTFFGSKPKFDSDEAQWIGTARYFQLLFVERDVSPASWPDDYWTRTHPMVHRYAIGAYLWWRGHDLNALDPHYDVWISHAENRRLGRVPSEAMLADARVPMRVLAALSLTGLYLLVRVLVGGVGGAVGGLVAAGLAGGSPYLQEHLVRAKSEATLQFFLVAGLLVAVVGLGRARSPRAQVGWGVAAGLVLGLAFATKLTAVLALVAVALWGAWAVVGGWLSSVRSSGDLGAVAGGRSGPAALPWRWPVAALGVALLVFVLTNPFLYPDPIGRTLILFQNRRVEMAEQQRNEPGRAVHDLRDRFALVWDRSLFNDAYGPSRLGRPVEAVLAPVGLAMLAFRGARRRLGAEACVLLWVLCIWAGISAALGFRLQHYFVPTALIGTMLAGLAVGWSLEAAWALARVRLPAFPGRAAPATPVALVAQGE